METSLGLAGKVFGIVMACGAAFAAVTFFLALGSSESTRSPVLPILGGLLIATLIGIGLTRSLLKQIR